MNGLWRGHDQCSYSGVYPQQHHWLELIRASGVFLTFAKTSCIYSVCLCYRHRLCVWGMLPIKRRNFPLRRWRGILAKRFGKKLLGPRQGPPAMCGACVQLSNLKFPNSILWWVLPTGFFSSNCSEISAWSRLQSGTLEPLSWKFWTLQDFVDISTHTIPALRTRAKMRWDDRWAVLERCECEWLLRAWQIASKLHPGSKTDRLKGVHPWCWMVSMRSMEELRTWSAPVISVEKFDCELCTDDSMQSQNTVWFRKHCI